MKIIVSVVLLLLVVQVFAQDRDRKDNREERARDRRDDRIEGRVQRREERRERRDERREDREHLRVERTEVAACTGMLANYTSFLMGLHWTSPNISDQSVVYHHCNKGEVMSCVLTDKLARVIGVEYIITEEQFKNLSATEQKLWHTHVAEVDEGMLAMPFNDDEEVYIREMRMLRNTFGKIIYTWGVQPVEGHDCEHGGGGRASARVNRTTESRVRTGGNQTEPRPIRSRINQTEPREPRESGVSRGRANRTRTSDADIQQQGQPQQQQQQERSCANADDCAACARLENCGWCSNTQKCMQGTQDGPERSEDVCVWSWAEQLCPDLCDAANDCLSCTELLPCGWCSDEEGKCLPGLREGPIDVVHATNMNCSSWKYLNSTCPADVGQGSSDPEPDPEFMRVNAVLPIGMPSFQFSFVNASIVDPKIFEVLDAVKGVNTTRRERRSLLQREFEGLQVPDKGKADNWNTTGKVMVLRLFETALVGGDIIKQQEQH